MAYYSTKTYGHERGLSCCFRQWRADSHCNMMHGYALAFSFKFEAATLDHNNWVVDFGGLKWLKAWLENQFDHTTLVAQDDPEMETFRMLHNKKLIDMRVIPGVGCEKTAEYVFDHVASQIDSLYAGRVKLISVEVREHPGNSAIIEVSHD
jgi:6-pyruvoyltetrahydropterin/6-carboxytetrahydropterin synthase